MKALDFSNIVKKYKNKWVALTPNNKKVIASGKSLNDVLNLAGKKGVKEPTVFKVPSVQNLFVG